MDGSNWTLGTIHERQIKLVMKSVQNSWCILLFNSCLIYMNYPLSVFVYAHQEFPWWYSGNHNPHLFELISLKKKKEYYSFQHTMRESRRTENLTQYSTMQHSSHPHWMYAALKSLKNSKGTVPLWKNVSCD